jgi:hypothetical protein
VQPNATSLRMGGGQVQLAAPGARGSRKAGRANLLLLLGSSEGRRAARGGRGWMMASLRVKQRGRAKGQLPLSQRSMPGRWQQELHHSNRTSHSWCLGCDRTAGRECLLGAAVIALDGSEGLQVTILACASSSPYGII